MDFSFFINITALLFSFFVVGAILGAVFSKPIRIKIAEILHLERFLRLHKSVYNPIIRPGRHPWNVEAVFNPAAVVLGGRTRLLYRAIGADGVSRLGYASSEDGIIFDKRFPYPAYVAQMPRKLQGSIRRYSPILYPSGGSWGGCEDPRMVAIGGRVYVTINIFDGWSFIRVAFISIAENELLTEQFEKWEGPYLLSPPGQIHKNWVLFPEKIGGRFAVLHSIVPKIEIAYCDSLEEIGTTEPFIKSWEGPRLSALGREDNWDNVIRGAGPPPIRTDRGWLLFYHATRANERHLYKLGAMLLDLVDPTKILYRAAVPILSPDERYENEGKPGIVYACGAVVRDGKLFVYYGGADKVICVATAPLQLFLDALIKGSQPRLIEQDAQTT